MMNNYNSLGYRKASVLNSREPDVVGNSPNSSGRLRTSWFVVLIVFLSVFTGQKLSAQTYFTENFEGSWFLNGNSATPATAAGPNAPSGWTQTRLGATLNSAPGTPGASGARDWAQQTWSGTAWASNTAPNVNQIPYNSATNGPTGAQLGSSVLWMNDGYFGSATGASRRIESPAIDLTASTAPIASFWYYYSSGTATVAIVASRDGGATWTTISSSNYTGGIATWTNYKVAIPAHYKVANAKIGILLVSNSWGSNDIFIDNVQVAEGTPPSAAPISLTYTAVASTTITANWVDNSTDETAFRVYRSTDNINFSLATTVTSTSVAGTGTAYNFAQTGLTPGTTYYYRVVAYKPEGETAPLSGSQATTAGATYYWVGPATGGSWGTAANWNTLADGTGSTRGTVATSDILVVDGAGTTAGGSVSISVDTASFSIGQFKVTSNTACTLASSATATRVITLIGGGGDDLVIQNGSTLTLNNATQAVAFAFSGSGNTGDISGTYNASGGTANVITTTGGTGTVVTVSSTGVVNNSIPGASGCLLGSAATLVFANGSNYTHSAFTTTNGFIPLATWGATSTVTITGGTTATGITNATQTFGNFVYNATGSIAIMSVWTTATTAVIQGNLTVSSTGTTGIFRAVTTGTVTVNGNLNVNGGTFAAFSSTGVVNVLGTTTVASGATLDISLANGTFNQRGTTFTNNGTVKGANATVTGILNFFSPANAALTLTGAGTFTPAISTIGVQTTGGLTVSTTNQVNVIRMNLFNGVVTGSNKITIGSGAAVGCTVQTGYSGNILAGGSFDVPPTFNLGTGNYSLVYSIENVARTTGNEIPSTRALTTINLTNTNGLVIAGGGLSTGSLTFGTACGNITSTASNLLTISGTTTTSITRTNAAAYVNGPLALTLPASLASGSTYTFPIGKGTLNTFALVNPTTNAGGTVVVRAEAFDASTGGTPSGAIGSIATNRYWAASIVSGSANFTNSLIQLNDTTTGLDAIAESASLTGAYTLTGGPSITTTATSLTSTAPASTTLPGFYVMGNKAAPTLGTISATPSGNQCTNVARTVSAVVTPGGSPIATVVINWTLNGVTQTAIPMTNTTGNGGLLADTWSGTIPTVTPANATVIWSVTATDNISLFKTSTTTTYNDEPLLGKTPSASASLSTICAGGSTVLTAKILGGAGSVTIGSGVTTTTLTEELTAFCNRRASYRMQSVFTAAELQAAGLVAGNITSIKFNIAANGDSTTNSAFVVKMGTTSLSTLTDYVSSTGFTTVFPSATYTHAIGLNTITFATPFNWDGTSNVVLEISHNGIDSINNATTFYSTTTGNTTAYGYNGATTGTLSTKRFNVVFTGVTGVNPSSVSWSDGSTTVGNTNNLSVSPTTTTTYTATITLNGCSTSANTTVTVNPLPTAPTGTDSTQCGSGVPTASVTSTTGATSPVFKWYAALNGGTALQTSTSTTYTTSVSGTTTFYVTEFNGTCESAPRTPVTVNVVTPPTITATASGASTFCGTGGTGVLTASSNDLAMTFVWTSLNTATGTVVSDVNGVLNYSVTATTTFRVTGTPVTNPSCAPVIYDYTVSVFPLPLAALTTNVNGVCPGFGNATITSDLAAGSFTSTSIAHAPLTAPGTATTLVSGGVINVTPNLSYGFAGDLDDSGWSGIPIGFNFKFFGTTYTNLSISTNGTLFMGTATDADVADFTFTTLPSASEPFKMVAVLAMDNDLSGANGGAIKYWTEGVAPNRKFIVSYEAVKEYADTKFSTAQAIFYETTGVVDVHVTSSTNVDRNKLVGINNGTGTIGVLAYASGTVTSTSPQNPIATAFAYRFTPPSDYTTVWSKKDSTTGGAFVTFATGTNLFSQVVTPSETTIYDLSYTNTTTGCTNAVGSSQVTINLLSTVAPTGVNTLASSATFCNGGTVNFSTDYTGATLGLTYQWQSSPDGLAWTDITAATLATYTASPTAATYYRCGISSCAGTPSYTTAKQVTPATTVDSTTPATRCGTGTVVLGATGSAGTTLNWYAAATGGTAIGTGSSFTTPVISSTTSYWVDANLGGSSANGGKPSTNGADGTNTTGGIYFTANSGFTLASVKMYPTGAGTNTIVLYSGSTTTGTALFTTTYTFTGASTTGVTVPLGWNITPGTYTIYQSVSGASCYRDTSGGASLPAISYPYNIGSACTLTDGTLAGYYYFFYDWNIQTGCSSARSEVVATVTTPPSLSLSTNTVAICSGSTSAAVTVTADPSYTSFVWSPSTGVTGTTSATFNPTVSGTYTLTASGGGCTNTATVNVVVNPLPKTVTFTPAAVTKCVEENPVAITSLSSGATSSVGCLSASSGLYPSATSTATTCNGTTVTTITTLAYAGEYSNVAVTSGYKYVFTSTGAGDYVTIGDAAGNTVLAAGPSPLAWFATSSAVVRFYSHTDSSCGEASVSRTRSYTCQPPASATGIASAAVWSPIAGLFTDAAGTTPYAGESLATVYAKPSSTTVYTATVTSDAGCPTSSTMTVTVNASIGGTANGGSTVCFNFPANTLSVTGNTGSVVRWEKSVSPFTTWTALSGSATASYTPTELLTATTQYRAVVKSGTCAEATSAPTTVTVNPGCAAKFTTIRSTFWNATVSPGAYISYQALLLPPGNTITRYKVELTNGTTNSVGTFESTATNFRIIDATPSVASYGTSYGIRVSLQINGVWQPYGPSKTVNTTALPVAPNLNTYCGQTIPTIDKILYCTVVPLAVSYTFEVTHNGSASVETATYTNTLNNFRLTNLISSSFSVVFNSTYSVRIKSKSLVNGVEVESLWSTPCLVTTPNTPPVPVITAGCGVVPTNSTLIKCTSISNASSYRFTIASTSAVFDLPRLYNSFSLSLIPGIAPGTVYTVTPYVTLYGQEYQGVPCDITSPGTAAKIEAKPAVTIVADFNVKAYPNPFAENFKLNVTTSSEDAMQVKVYDMLGKLIEVRDINVSEIETLEVGSNYPTGVYNVVVSQGENTQTLRVIKR